MKKVKDIVEEIEAQSKAIKSKGATPALIVLGDFAYYTLKVNHPELIEKVPNGGTYLKEFMGLKVICKPIYESGSVFKKEHESVEVFGQ